MFCGGKKNKKGDEASRSAPKSQYADTAASPVDDKLTRQKSFYGSHDDIIPIKVDYIQVKKADDKEAYGSRFFVLTDSVLICFDEAVKGQNHIEFVKHSFFLKNTEVKAVGDLNIELTEAGSTHQTILVLRSKQH